MAPKIKAEEKEKDRVAKESMQAVGLMAKMAEQEMEDDTKRDLKLAEIEADFAKEEGKTSRDIELENIQTHRDERLGGEE